MGILNKKRCKMNIYNNKYSKKSFEEWNKKIDKIEY
jgi:hypothetical protein